MLPVFVIGLLLGIGATVWSARNSKEGPKEEASAKTAGDSDAVPIQIEDKLQKLPETPVESIVHVKETRM